MSKEQVSGMSRRDFLKFSTTATVAAVLGMRTWDKLTDRPEVRPESKKPEAPLKKVVNDALAEPNLRLKHRKEHRLFQEYKDRPFALELILPAIMNTDVRSKIISRRWQFRTDAKSVRKLPNQQEVRKYQLTHPPLAEKELEFCHEHGILPESYASLRDVWPKITKALHEIDARPKLNLGALAELIDTETGGGVYLGDGPARLQWNRRWAKSGKYMDSLETAFAQIGKRTGLRYDPRTVFGSTWPDKDNLNTSGGAVGIQIMPHNIKVATPPGYRGLNPFDIYGHDGWADAPFMSLYFLHERIGDEPANEDSLRQWNGNSQQIDSILKAGFNYVKQILDKA
jgi:hypothetical protein